MGDTTASQETPPSGRSARRVDGLVTMGIVLFALSVLTELASSLTFYVGWSSPFWEGWPSAVPFYMRYLAIAILAVAVAVRIKTGGDAKSRVRYGFLLVLTAVATVGPRLMPAGIDARQLVLSVLLTSLGAFALPFASGSRRTGTAWAVVVVLVSAVGVLGASISDGWSGVVGLPVASAVMGLASVAMVAGLAGISRRSLWSVVLLSLTAMLGLASAFSPMLAAPIITSVEKASSPQEFSPAAWEDGVGHRQNMARDLLSQGLLDDKSRDQVTELIGIPDDSWDYEGYFGIGGEEDGREYFGLDEDSPLPVTCDTYTLNYPGEYAAVDVERLVIGYDESGRVLCAIVTAN